MATVSKEIADDIIAGKYADDTPTIRIVKYTNMVGGDAYGVIYEGEDPMKYHNAVACTNPTIYWDSPRMQNNLCKEIVEEAAKRTLMVTLFVPPTGRKEIHPVTDVKPEDVAWFNEHHAKISMEHLGDQYVLYADVGIRTRDGEVDECIVFSGTRTCNNALTALRKECEKALAKQANKEKP